MSRVHGSSYLKTVLGELAKYKLDSVGVEKVRCDKSGTEPADDCMYILLWKWECYSSLRDRLFYT
jgi:hypothetical protein